MRSPSRAPLPRLRAVPWLLALLGLGGCSDFLGIDQFEDEGTTKEPTPDDVDDPGVGGSGAGGGTPSAPLDGTLRWWVAHGASGRDEATSVALLPDAIRVAGRIEGAVDFGGGAVGSSGRQAFAASMDRDGQHRWSLATEGEGAVDDVLVASASDGSIVLAGSYRHGGLVLGGESLPTPAPGQAVVFLAWLSPAGVASASLGLSVAGEVSLRAIALSPSGDVAIAGGLRGSMTVGETSLTGSPDDEDALLLVVDSGSAAKLATHLRAAGDEDDQHLSAVRYDDAGDLWIGGTFRGTLAFDATSLTSIGASDGIVARVEPDGSLGPHRQVGGGAAVVDVTALHPQTPFVIGGRFTETLLLGDAELDSEGADDFFIARLDDDLDPAWARGFGTSGSDGLGGLAVDAAGHVTLAGSISGTLPLIETEPLISAGGQDLMIAKLDAEGAPLWARSLGREEDDRAHDVAADGDGRVVAVGSFAGGLSLDGELLTSSGEHDAVLVELGP